MIELGDKVKCRITGFAGVVVAKSEFINGCVQFSVAPKVTKDNKYPEEIGIDEGSLVIVSKRKKETTTTDSGGSSTKGLRMRGF